MGHGNTKGNMMPATRTRTRSRATDMSITDRVPVRETMSELAERVYAAKVRADSAENAYSELKAEMLARMESDNLKAFEIPADGDRPAVSFKPDARATNTIDALKFAGMVKPSELAQCVTVQITKARDFVGKAKLDAITTSVVGTPFLAVRVIGKKAK